MPPVRRSPVLWALQLAFTALSVTVVVAILVWPYVAPNPDRIHVVGLLPVEELGDDVEVMFGATYEGIDRRGRSYAISAEAIRIEDEAQSRMRLTSPDLKSALPDGRPVTMRGRTGLYDRFGEALELREEVHLTLNDAYRLDTSEATLDLAAGTISGDAPVIAEGPFGRVQADGFRITNQGVVTFVGRSRFLPDPAVVGGGADG